MKNLFLLIIIIFLIISCEPLNSPGQPDFNYSILFNLVANKKEQEIYIYKVVSGNEQLSYKLGKFFVKDARISLKSNNWQYNKFNIIKDNTYFNQSKGFHYSNNDSLKILPNTKYNLEINIDDYKILGTIITPDDFRIISPQSNSILKHKDLIDKNIVLTWSKSLSAQGYIIKSSYSYFIEYEDSLYNGLDITSYITQDTSFAIKLFYVGNGLLTLEVQAYDKNYHDHIIEKIPNKGIKNAYGYFGSSVLKSVTVNIE